MIAAAVERLLRQAAPAGSELELQLLFAAEPALIALDSAPLKIGLDAFEHVLGVRPLLVRIGGSLPIVSALAAMNIPTIVSGFWLPDANPSRAERAVTGRAHRARHRRRQGVVTRFAVLSNARPENVADSSRM